MQGGWGSERGGPRDWGSNPPSPFKTLPPSPPGPDSVDICAIAHPGGNQIIFKPEIIFFIIVTDSIFFLFCVTRCVCTYIYIYIYYKYQRNYISILGREDEGGRCVRGPLLFLFLRLAGRGEVSLRSSSSPRLPLLVPAPIQGPSTPRWWWWCCCVVRKDTQGEEGRGRVRRGGRLSPVTGGGGVVRRAWWSSSNNTGVAPPSWGRGGRAGFFSRPLKALLPRSHG